MSAASWRSASTLTVTSGETQMLTRSACRRVAAGSPRRESAALAIDRALESAGAPLRPRCGKSTSQARSRLIVRPGLSRTSSQRRLAVGRAHGPALLAPAEMENDPNSLTCTSDAPGRPSGGSGVTVQLCQFRPGKTAGRGLP